MSHARSGVSLLLGLAALAAAGAAPAEPPAPPPPAATDPAPDGGTPSRPAVPEGKAPAPTVARPGPVLQVAIDREQRAKQAMALHDEAWALYEEGRYRAALDRLKDALRIDPEGRELVYNLATLHEKLGDLKEAAASYRRYLEMETDPRARAKAQVILRRLEGAEKEAAIAASLVPVPPRAPPPQPPPRPVRPWVVATGSVAGVSFVLGTIFGLRALEQNPGAAARTGNGVSIADLQSAAHAAHTDAVVADVSFLVTAAAAGTAMFLYFLTPRSSRGAPPIGPVVGARVAAGSRPQTSGYDGGSRPQTPGLWQVTF